MINPNPPNTQNSKKLIENLNNNIVFEIPKNSEEAQKLFEILENKSSKTLNYEEIA